MTAPNIGVPTIDASFRSISATRGLGTGISTVKTGAYVMAPDDPNTVIYDCTAAGFNITLPLASQCVSAVRTFLGIGTVNNCTLFTAGADTIQNGSVNSNNTNLAFGQRISFQSDGVSKWYRII